MLTQKSKLTFSCIPNAEELRVVYIFEEYDFIPVLFVMADLQDCLYFCVCTEYRNEQRWVLVKTDIETLSSLSHGSIDTRYFFEQDDEDKYLIIRDYLNGNTYHCELLLATDRNIPDAGCYLDDGEYDVFGLFYNEYIRHQQRICLYRYHNFIPHTYGDFHFFKTVSDSSYIAFIDTSYKIFTPLSCVLSNRYITRKSIIDSVCLSSSTPISMIYEACTSGTKQEKPEQYGADQPELSKAS